MNEDWSEFLLAPTLNHFFFIYNHHDDFHTIQYITLQFSHFLLPSVQYIFPLINFNTNKIENDWIKFEINKTYLENLVIRCWVWYLFQKTKTVRQITEFSSSFTEWITLSSSQTGPDVNVRRDGKKKIAENVWQFNLTDWNKTRRARERKISTARIPCTLVHRNWIFVFTLHMYLTAFNVLDYKYIYLL